MSAADTIAEHYTSGELWRRLRAALIDDGIDPEHPTVQALAPYDQFHGRGLEATEEMADGLALDSGDRVLDVGCGLGGPARYIAHRFGCHVTGIDLTAEFCELARQLTRLVGLEDRVAIELGSALAMPFDAGAFDGAYSMNVSMNIADKAALYREIHRVLRPGGWLVLSEIAQGPNAGLEYPTPWARTASASFLVTPQQTRALLEANGFEVHSVQETAEAARDYGTRSREAVGRGEKPLHRAVHLVHGALADIASANTARGAREGCIVPIEVHCRRGPN